jgi:hypothetical protein
LNTSVCQTRIAKPVAWRSEAGKESVSQPIESETSQISSVRQVSICEAQFYVSESGDAEAAEIQRTVERAVADSVLVTLRPKKLKLEMLSMLRPAWSVHWGQSLHTCQCNRKVEPPTSQTTGE